MGDNMKNKQEQVRNYLTRYGPASVHHVSTQLNMEKTACANAMTNARIKGWVRQAGAGKWEAVSQGLEVIEDSARVLEFNEPDPEPLVTIKVYSDHARISLPDAQAILKAVGG